MALSPNGSVLRLRHLLLVLLVVAIWGTNFVVIHAGLTEFPPLLFATLRFLFCALPAIILIRRPPVSLASLAAYGLLIGAGQFGLLYIAVNGPIAPGLASLVIQMQVPFTILLSAILLNEPLHRRQALTFVLCGLGLSAVAW